MTTGILSTHGDSVVCYLFDDELKWQQKHSRNFGIVFVFFFFGGRPNSNQICIDYIEIPYSFAILRALILSFFWLKKNDTAPDTFIESIKWQILPTRSTLHEKLPKPKEIPKLFSHEKVSVSNAIRNFLH